MLGLVVPVLEVDPIEGAQVVDARVRQILHAPGVSTDRSLEHVAGEASVAEGVVPRGGGEDLPEPCGGRLGEDVVVPLGEGVEDRGDLVVGVVVERDRRAEPAREAGIGVDEPRHRRGIAGDDDDELVALVLHLLDEGVDGLLPVLVAREGVGLVDEQHTPDRGRGDLGGLDGGLAEVARDELGAVDLDELSGAEQPERVVDPADETRDGRLAGAGVADEHEVARHRRRSEACLTTLGVDLEHRDLLMDLPLDPAQPDEVVEFGEEFLDRLLGLGRLGRRGRVAGIPARVRRRHRSPTVDGYAGHRTGTGARRSARIGEVRGGKPRDAGDTRRPHLVGWHVVSSAPQLAGGAGDRAELVEDRLGREPRLGQVRRRRAGRRRQAGERPEAAVEDARPRPAHRP